MKQTQRDFHRRGNPDHRIGLPGQAGQRVLHRPTRRHRRARHRLHGAQGPASSATSCRSRSTTGSTPTPPARSPGGFFKREGRPSEKEIITSRQIDRPLRPLFPDGYKADTQIIAFCLSADGENDPDILAINGASIALVLSNIPFYHPVGAVRVGLIDGEVVMNPTNSLRDVSDLDLVVVGTEDAVVMVEAGANQVSEELILECIWRGHRRSRRSSRRSTRCSAGGNREKPSWTAPETYPESLYEQVKAEIYGAPEGRPLHQEEVRAQGRRQRGRQALHRADPPRTTPRRRPTSRRSSAASRRRSCARWCSTSASASTAGSLDEIRPIDDRGRRAPPHPRLGAVHPRRDAGAGHGDARHQPRRPGDRGVRGGERPEVPAALQLPPLLGRRGQVPARPRPARDRPRRAGPARAAPRAAARGRVPVHHPPGLRHPGVERLLVDGDDLRRLARPVRRRRAAARPGRGSRDGPDQGGERQLRGALRHRRPGRPLRRHGLQGRRHPPGHHRAPDGHQDHRRHARDHAGRRWSRPRPAACTSWGSWRRRSPSRAPTSPSSRRVSTRCRSPRRRSATSSDPAARRSARSSRRPAATSRSRTTAGWSSPRPTSRRPGAPSRWWSA